MKYQKGDNARGAEIPRRGTSNRYTILKSDWIKILTIGTF